MIYEKILLGVSFAAPIGPVTAEAIRRGLLGGFSPAFRVKIGAAIGDTIFLIVAYYGISAILRFESLCHILAMLGSGLLIYIGYRNILKSIKPPEESYSVQESLKGGMWLGLGIALTNPFAVAWWLSVFSALLLESGHSNSFAGLMENMYIIVGIVLWDLAFCTLLAGGKKLVNDFFIRVITALAGVSLCGYGVYFGTTAFGKVFLS